MQLEDYSEADGKRVWLARDEAELFLDQVDGTEKFIGLGLALRSGLRAAEVVQVTPDDVLETQAGYKVRIWEGKGDKYREPPLSQNLYHRIDSYSDVRSEPSSAKLIDRSPRTLRRWAKRAAENCYEETHDRGWKFLGAHDLRRTWAMLLLESNVEPGMVMTWGGWDDWSTFRDHYLGRYSPDMQRREMNKVDWLTGGSSHQPEPADPRGQAQRMPRSRGRFSEH